MYNTDANAGAHGRNAEEIVAYVTQGGQSPMNAVVAATSRAAESLGSGRFIFDRIGNPVLPFFVENAAFLDTLNLA